MLRVGIASGDWVSPTRSHDKTQHWGGSGWARIGQYVDKLPFEVHVGTLTWNRTHLAIFDPYGEPQDVDVILMQRLMHKGIAKHIKQSQAAGIKIINDIDDWYWGVSPSNMAFRHNHPTHNANENTNHYKATLSASDLVLCSTPYLRERISEFVNCPIEITPNTIDTSKYSQHVDSGSTTPIVGWVGSTGHRSNDIETLKGIIDPMVRNELIHLYHGGHIDNYPSFASLLGLSPYDVMTAPIATTEMYPSLMIMDIGIIPLNTIPFNRCKSDIKGLEYAASGIPFIAQNLDAYCDLNASLGIGRIAKRPVNWLRHLEELRTNPKLRAEEGLFNREKVVARDIKYGVQKLAEIISAL